MNTFEKARNFVYRNARPLDLTRWQYHFENGSAEAVLHALSYYQNEDGGFGHGLESDYLNPNSTPIATWAATEILREIDFTDNTHPIVQGILHYLDSGADFDTAQNQWLNTVPTNNDYPHAIWWTHKGTDNQKYNPTAPLAGFILKFADKGSDLYQKGLQIATEAVNWFLQNVPFEEQHITACFVQLYEYLTKADLFLAEKFDITTASSSARGTDISPRYSIDIAQFKEKLLTHVHENICHDHSLWAIKYTAKPSDYFNSPESIFYPDSAETAKAELTFIIQNQLDDGSFPVTWQWWTDYKEFEVSVIHWKCIFCINNMRYLRNFGVL